MANRQAASLEDAFERALGAILARVAVSGARIALAYSGGLDSSALLQLAHRYAIARGIELFAFHVHHGLSPNAERWLTHCESTCAAQDVRFDARRVVVDAAGEGIEQAARKMRYAALGELCRAHGIKVLLTAHHQDDQAETVLLQLLRGAGIAGLSGMEALYPAPDLVGGSDPLLARPLLAFSRAELEAYVAQHRIAHIDDESNSDVRHARNALRQRIMPVLAEHFPGFQERIARSAQHAHAAQCLLEDLASSDFNACAIGGAVDINRLVQLSEERINNVLRHWFARKRVRMPSTAWLAQMRAQVFAAREDAQVRIVHPDCEIRRHRNRIYVIPRMVDAYAAAAPVAFRWQGEDRIVFKPFGGSLYFVPSDKGIDAEWLRSQSLELRHRSGGEKLKLASGRPSRSLKNHFQALDIPVWERVRLPVVVASGRLLFAAGLGINIAEIRLAAGNGVNMRWENDIDDENLT